jgi:flagellar hook-basal body complex protein FliE
MSSINAIGSSLGPIMPKIGGATGPADSGAIKTNFSELLRGAIDRVESDQQASGQAIGDLITGKSPDALSAVTAVAQADMSFKLLMGVRNKVIDAYKQTMNMQI